MTRYDYGFAGMITTFAVVIAVGVLGLFFPRPPHQPHINLAQYARKAQLGMGAATLNKLTNAKVGEILAPLGVVPKQVTILQTRIDGDTAYVGVRFKYGLPNGPAVGGTEATLIFHRSVWSFGQLAPGIRGPKS